MPPPCPRLSREPRPKHPLEPSRLAFAIRRPLALRVQVVVPAPLAVAVPIALPLWTCANGPPLTDDRENLHRVFHVVSRTAGLPFSSILPKIILPLAVCSTLVTEIPTDRPISLRA